MENVYGLPATPGYDSPYGVPSTAPVLRDMSNAVPLMQFPRPAIEAAQGGGGNVIPMPMRAPPSVVPAPMTMRGGAQDITSPLVGRDMAVGQLIKIQRKAESTGNYHAINKEQPGNTASGAYQYTDSTWNNYGGYPKALLAPPEVQDRRFAEDIANRVAKYNGDLFKAIADHYLPAYANDPSAWRQSQRIKTRKGTVVVQPVETYLRHVLKNTPYIEQLDEYINAHQ